MHLNMEMTEENKTAITRMAAAAFSLAEIADVLEVQEEVLASYMEDKDNDFY